MGFEPFVSLNRFYISNNFNSEREQLISPNNEELNCANVTQEVKEFSGTKAQKSQTSFESS